MENGQSVSGQVNKSVLPLIYPKGMNDMPDESAGVGLVRRFKIGVMA